MVGLELQKLQYSTCGQDERNQDGAGSNECDCVFGQPLADEAIDEESKRWKERDQPNQI